MHDPQWYVWNSHTLSIEESEESEAAPNRCSYKKVSWKYAASRCSMPKLYFNKVAKQLYLNHTSAWVFCCKFAACFQNTFSYEHLWRSASEPRFKHNFKSCINPQCTCSLYIESASQTLSPALPSLFRLTYFLLRWF